MVVGGVTCSRLRTVAFHIPKDYRQLALNLVVVEKGDRLTFRFYSRDSAMFKRRDRIFTVGLYQNSIPRLDKPFVDRNNKRIANRLHFYLRWVVCCRLHSTATAQLSSVTGNPVTETSCPCIGAEGTVYHQRDLHYTFARFGITTSSCGEPSLIIRH
jgi:hypothetical protein